ncbi:SPOR domain-containing protein [Marinobacter sp. CHS3-4]|uniref:SPOR domain-containing protein n=1 Tax=Marinobacter sp. CHS3-4 TaxID=3045174 RepID=UPI0024B4FE0D|nr:SPOR domain-containing protein [Marinobacter sp. CHS3-4]MDI9244472.1 SPOR domain-containing protein [Marinobacter sp. CHS3-4]
MREKSSASDFQISMFAVVVVCLLQALLGFPQSTAQGLDDLSGGDAPLSLENELLLDVRVEGQPVGYTILAYQRNDQVFLALSELMDAIRFPINVDAEQGLAGGWFIKEERDFSLDFNSNEVVIAGRSFTVNESDAVVFGNDIFVTLDALSEWFPLDFTPDIRRLSLNVFPEERIPLQERLSRMDRRSGGGSLGRQEAQFPLQMNPYRLVGPYTADLRLNTSSSRSDNDSSTSLSGNYSTLVVGDLLWMTSTLALAGSDDDELSSGRFKLERDDLDWPLGVNSIELGDVQGGGARGVLVRGGDSREGVGDGLFANDLVDLRGDIPADWEVELYRNGLLIDSQIVGNDAQYEFLDVPLEFGENIFEFVFYGPFGEQRTETEIYYAGREDLDFGEVNYRFSAVQDDRTVLGIDDLNTGKDEGAGRYAANINAGLFSGTSLNLGVTSFERNDERYEDYTAGLTANFARVQTNLGYSWSALGQDSASLKLRARLGEQTTSQVSYTEFFKRDSEINSATLDRNLWQASASLSSKIYSLNYGLSARHQERLLSKNSSADAATSFTAFGTSRFSTSLSYTRNEDQTVGGEVREAVQGGSSFSTRVRPWSLRTGASYRISPETELSSLFGSAFLRVARDMSFNLEVRRSLDADLTRYRTGFNWTLDYLTVSPQVIYDSEDNWIGLLSLSTSLTNPPGGFDPQISGLSQTGFGAVKSRVFIDDNGNGVWNAGDIPLNDVSVEALQSWRRENTNAQGNAYLTRMSPTRRTDIAIDPATLDDFELQSSAPGVSVKPRRGSWSVVDFPMVRTSELEGHVYVEPARNAERIPGSRAPVELVDEDGNVVSRQRAAFDGFYLFSSVLPGEYRVRLGSSVSSTVSRQPDSVQVTSSGGVIRNLDFVLQTWRDENIQNLATGLSDNADDEPRPSFAPPADGATPAEVTPSEIVQPEPEPVIVEEPLTEPVQTVEETVEVTPPPSGNWYVQLGAFSLRENATRRWEALQDEGIFPDGQEPRYQDVGSLVRLLTGVGLPEERARALCDRIKSEDLGDCLVRELTE